MCSLCTNLILNLNLNTNLDPNFDSNASSPPTSISVLGGLDSQLDAFRTNERYDHQAHGAH